MQVRKDTTDRLVSARIQPAKSGNVMQVKVLDHDVGWDSDANEEVPSGWRAEARSPWDEIEGDSPVRYEWSTMLDPSYVVDPVKYDGQPPFQVITQWHQADQDRGLSPPIAWIIVGDNILVDLYRHDPEEVEKSIPVGRWPVAKELDRGAWHTFAAEIRWHPTEGSIRVWHNGTPVTFEPQTPPDLPDGVPYPERPTKELTSLETLFPPRPGALKPPSVYMKVGLYRDDVPTTPSGPYLLYHDEISRSRQVAKIPGWWLIDTLVLPDWLPG